MYWVDPNLRYATREADVMVSHYDHKTLLVKLLLLNIDNLSHHAKAVR